MLVVVAIGPLVAKLLSRVADRGNGSRPCRRYADRCPASAFVRQTDGSALAKEPAEAVSTKVFFSCAYFEAIWTVRATRS